MSLPRRGFVKTGVLTAVSAGIAISNPGLLFSQVGSPLAVELPPSTLEDPVFSFTQSSFEGYVGDIFTAANARGERVELKLVAVTGYQIDSSTKIMLAKIAQPKSFSLTFTSRDKLPEFTSIHNLNHPRLGDFDLFLTPKQNEDGTHSYEAVISHL